MQKRITITGIKGGNKRILQREKKEAIQIMGKKLKEEK